MNTQSTDTGKTTAAPSLSSRLYRNTPTTIINGWLVATNSPPVLKPYSCKLAYENAIHRKAKRVPNKRQDAYHGDWLSYWGVYLFWMWVEEDDWNYDFGRCLEIGVWLEARSARRDMKLGVPIGYATLHLFELFGEKADVEKPDPTPPPSPVPDRKKILDLPKRAIRTGYHRR